MFTDRSTDCCFEGRNSFALAAAHLDADRVRRRAVLVHVEDQAGGAGVISVGGGELFDGRRRRRIGLGGWRLGSSGSLGWWILLFGLAATKPAAARARGQQDAAEETSKQHRVAETINHSLQLDGMKIARKVQLAPERH